MLHFWGRYFWLIALVVSVANAAILWVRSRSEVARNPELDAGYTKLIIGVLTWGNIPWLVMGYGVIAGGVPSLWYYFRPQDRDPFVLAWFGSILFLSILGTVWLFLWRGAEMVARHAAVLNSGALIPSARMVKVLWVVSLAGGLAGFIFVWLSDIPLGSLPLG